MDDQSCHPLSPLDKLSEERTIKPYGLFLTRNIREAGQETEEPGARGEPGLFLFLEAVSQVSPNRTKGGGSMTAVVLDFPRRPAPADLPPTVFYTRLETWPLLGEWQRTWLFRPTPAAAGEARKLVETATRDLLPDDIRHFFLTCVVLEGVANAAKDAGDNYPVIVTLAKIGDEIVITIRDENGRFDRWIPTLAEIEAREVGLDDEHGRGLKMCVYFVAAQGGMLTIARDGQQNVLTVAFPLVRDSAAVAVA